MVWAQCIQGHMHPGARQRACRPPQYFCPACLAVSSAIRISDGCSPASFRRTVFTCPPLGLSGAPCNTQNCGS